MQYGLRRLRSKKRLDACLDEMASRNLISLSEIKKYSVCRVLMLK